jgi:hypothetical protein
MNHKGHNAADAAHKGVHKKINLLCPLCLCGSICVICFKKYVNVFLSREEKGRLV